MSDIDLTIENISEVTVTVDDDRENITVVLQPAASGSGYSKQAKLNFSYGDVTTQVIYSAIAGQRITRVELGFDIAFNVASSLKVGDGANIQRLMDTGQNNPLAAHIYSTCPFYKYTENTDIILTINAGIGATQGAGTVIIYFE